LTRPPPIIKGKTERAPYDEEIRSKFINLVTTAGEYQSEVNKRSVLEKLNRSEEHLVQVSDPDPSDPFSLPTCRIYTKVQLRDRAKKTEVKAKELAKKLKSGKVIEMHWVIAPGDLEIKCKQLRGFLEEGRKVDVLLLPPQRRKHVRKEGTPAEMSAIVTRIQQEVESIDGAEEAGESEGKMGGMMTMFFSGVKVIAKKS
jgi:translation initiation factor IF-3